MHSAGEGVVVDRFGGIFRGDVVGGAVVGEMTGLEAEGAEG